MEREGDRSPWAARSSPAPGPSKGLRAVFAPLVDYGDDSDEEPDSPGQHLGADCTLLLLTWHKHHAVPCKLLYQQLPDNLTAAASATVCRSTRETVTLAYQSVTQCYEIKHTPEPGSVKVQVCFGIM